MAKNRKKNKAGARPRDVPLATLFQVATEGQRAELARLIAQLASEHRRLLNELRAIREELRADANGSVPPQLAIRTPDLLQDLARHESRENQYVVDAAGGRDTGASD